MSARGYRPFDRPPVDLPPGFGPPVITQPPPVPSPRGKVSRTAPHPVHLRQKRTPRFEHPLGLVPLIQPEQGGFCCISHNGKNFGHSLYFIFGMMVLFLEIFPYRPRSPPDRLVPHARLANGPRQSGADKQVEGGVVLICVWLEPQAKRGYGRGGYVPNSGGLILRPGWRQSFKGPQGESLFSAACRKSSGGAGSGTEVDL